MSATWYDVLGVEPTASAEEIRAAWKDAIADLEPTDRRFRACNQAAEILLDADKRAAYDAELGPESEPEAVAPEPAEPAPAAPEPPVSLEKSYEPAPVVVQEASGFARLAQPISTTALAVLAALAATVAVLAAVVWFAVDAPAEDAESSVREARDTAADAMPVLFSYSYKTAETDRDQALRRTTGCFHDQLEELWDEALLPSIGEAKAVANSTIEKVGVVRSSDDGDRVELVVVLNVKTSSKAASNQEVLNFTVTMVDEDGTWLVEDVKGDNPFASGGEPESDECAGD